MRTLVMTDDQKPMHVHLLDTLTETVLIDEDLKPGGFVENTTCMGNHLGAGVIHGPVYHGVKVWVAPRHRVYDWEPDGDSVFVQWTDRSNSRDPAKVVEIVHTVERPLPGGGIGRFLVTVS